jgi:hypothetical protein
LRRDVVHTAPNSKDFDNVVFYNKEKNWFKWENLRKLESHVHPYFAIAHATRYLNTIDIIKVFPPHLYTDSPIGGNLIKIFHYWVKMDPGIQIINDLKAARKSNREKRDRKPKRQKKRDQGPGEGDPENGNHPTQGNGSGGDSYTTGEGEGAADLGPQLRRNPQRTNPNGRGHSLDVPELIDGAASTWGSDFTLVSLKDVRTDVIDVNFKYGMLMSWRGATAGADHQLGTDNFYL